MMPVDGGGLPKGVQPHAGRLRAHLETLAAFTATPDAGCTRLSNTPEFRAACDYVAERARELGMAVQYDAVGNMRARLPGREQATCVMVGSHLDSVLHGGNFDGVLGVVCALEVVQAVVESGWHLRRPLELVAFAEEEGTTFRCPLAGSKALTGVLEVNDLQTLRDESGRSWSDVLQAYGLQPETMARDSLAPSEVYAMLELHIEQGGVLEEQALPVGIVEHIAGSENHRIRLHGRTNHAGTTPMHLRCDALAAAAEMIVAIEQFATLPEWSLTVATVGRILCRPNAVNVIPGEVEFSVDVRDIDALHLSQAATAIEERIATIAAQRDIAWQMDLTVRSAPQPLSTSLVERLCTLAAKTGISHRRMVSGALHDAAMLARVTEAGMIFVPSHAGCSHTPQEWTAMSDIMQGTTLLLAAVVALAEE